MGRLDISLSQLLYEESKNDILDLVFEEMFFKDMLIRHKYKDVAVIFSGIVVDLQREIKESIKLHNIMYKDNVNMKLIRKMVMREIMTKDEAIQIILEVQNLSYNPSVWEDQFMNSIGETPYDKLTFKQSKTLQSIYQNATGGGRYQNRNYV